MPLIIKICITLAVIWSTVYTFSFAAAEFKDKNRHGGTAAAVLAVILIAVYFVCIPAV